MSTFHTIKVPCATCGKTSSHVVVTRTSSFGSADIDTRPAPLARYTLHADVQKCPHCGYAWSRIDEGPVVDADFLRSNEYKTADHHEMHPLAVTFYQAGLIARKSEQYEDAFRLYLCAAWVCDDNTDVHNARECRLAAIRNLVRPDVSPWDDDATRIIVYMDLLRRTQQFSKVLQYPATPPPEIDDELYTKLYQYERYLASEQDDACHRTEDAFNHEILGITIAHIKKGTQITMADIPKYFEGLVAEELRENIQTNVLIALDDIPARTKLTADSIDNLFKEISINKETHNE